VTILDFRLRSYFLFFLNDRFSRVSVRRKTYSQRRPQRYDLFSGHREFYNVSRTRRITCNTKYVLLRDHRSVAVACLPRDGFLSASCPYAVHTRAHTTPAAARISNTYLNIITFSNIIEMRARAYSSRPQRDICFLFACFFDNDDSPWRRRHRCSVSLYRFPNLLGRDYYHYRARVYGV